MEPVLISALEHWSYCPRQCGLIHLESVWDENVLTLRGKAAHERADAPVVRRERGRRVERALPLWSERYGLQGRADVVEFSAEARPTPVEYKVGRATPHRHAHVQLCAQALCLEEMFGHSVPEGAIFYVASQRREAVALDEPLRATTLAMVEEVRAMRDAGVLPEARYDRRCRQCSLLDACLPQTMERVAAVARLDPFAPLGERELP
jgi:CRISPR-associated exonuclease Cas4